MSQTLRGWRKGGWSLSPDPCFFIQTPSWTRLRPGALLISLETWRIFFTIILGRRKCPLRINFDLQGHFLPWIHFIGLRRSILLLSGHACHICMCICIYAFHVCHILSAVWILPLRSNSVPTPHPLQILLNIYREKDWTRMEKVPFSTPGWGSEELTPKPEYPLLLWLMEMPCGREVMRMWISISWVPRRKRKLCHHFSSLI